MCHLVWVVPQKCILGQGFRCEWFSWRHWEGLRKPERERSRLQSSHEGLAYFRGYGRLEPVRTSGTKGRTCLRLRLCLPGKKGISWCHPSAGEGCFGSTHSVLVLRCPACSRVCPGGWKIQAWARVGGICGVQAPSRPRSEYRRR